MKVQVAGYKGKGFGGGVIKWFSFGTYSHVSLVFTRTDGRMEEIESIQMKGVHCQQFVKTDKVDLFDFEHTEDQAWTIYLEAVGKIGCRYDWAGVWALVRRRKRQNPNKWFCSELVAHCLLKAGITLQNMEPWKQLPVITCASVVLKPAKRG